MSSSKKKRPSSKLGGTAMASKVVWPDCEHNERMTLDSLQEWMDREAARLHPHRAEVPKSWRRMAVPGYYFPRECFPRAIYFVREARHLPALYMIGEAVCGGLQQHGWVEIEADGLRVVFDGTLQEFYQRDAYYESEHTRPWYRFTRPAVLWLDRLSQRQEYDTYRWDRLLRLPWADFTNPELITLESAKRYWQERNAKETAP
jgi:hypothetical protein